MLPRWDGQEQEPRLQPGVYHEAIPCCFPRHVLGYTKLNCVASWLQITGKPVTGCTLLTKMCVTRVLTLANSSSHLELRHAIFQMLYFKLEFFIFAWPAILGSLGFRATPLPSPLPMGHSFFLQLCVSLPWPFTPRCWQLFISSGHFGFRNPPFLESSSNSYPRLPPFLLPALGVISSYLRSNFKMSFPVV